MIANSINWKFGKPQNTKSTLETKKLVLNNLTIIFIRDKFTLCEFNDIVEYGFHMGQ